MHESLVLLLLLIIHSLLVGYDIVNDGNVIDIAAVLVRDWNGILWYAMEWYAISE